MKRPAPAVHKDAPRRARSTWEGGKGAPPPMVCDAEAPMPPKRCEGTTSRDDGDDDDDDDALQIDRRVFADDEVRGSVARRALPREVHTRGGV